jgi:hypothetical protein
MLRSMKDLEGYAIQATDGVIGHVKDFYFDDEAWVVRYLIVETGSWLSSRKVLISPISIGKPDWIKRVLPVVITMEQVRKSPDIDTDKPVSRQHEAQYLGYYDYPCYWGGGGLWSGGVYPGMLAGTAHDDSTVLDGRAPAQEGSSKAETAQDQDAAYDRHLRSCQAVLKYRIEATDGDIGHVDGLLVDEETWAIRYMVVDTNGWWLGHQVVMAPAWIHEVRWADRTVRISVTREAVRAAPQYDASVPLSRDREVDLYRHHGRSGYWAEEVKLQNPQFRVAGSAPPRAAREASEGTTQGEHQGA